MRSGAYVSRVAVAILLLVAILTAPVAVAEEKVAFNVESKKYHCLDCRWAIACTKNCVTVALSEARRRGGVPCKVCGGTCR